VTVSGRIVVIGNFDGVHLGHQRVLRAAADEAAARGLGAAMLTFSPHPARVIGREPPATLTRLARKLELARRVAPSIEPIVQRFDAAFAAQSPRAFADAVLARDLGAAVVVVGKNFRFGKDRAGDFDELARLGAELGFETTSHDLLADERGRLSSTRARRAIAAGDLDDAARVLGRPHMIEGLVARGDQRGRTIGFPTANLADVEEALPANGVYAVLVDRVDGARVTALAKGVANVGVRPTVGQQPRPSVEVNLFDFDGDLYGAELRVHVALRLRDEQRFAGLEALKAQIALDAAAARAALGSAAPRDGAYG
jgi:riboflavin kinase/FMN adenylyltransferase